MTAPENLERLPERAEALLDGWPAPARGALEWEDAAARTMEQVRETAIGSTADALLEAPLAEGDGEGSLAAPSARAIPDPAFSDEPLGLADIARAALAAGAGTSPNDVAREVMRVTEEERRSAPPPPPVRQLFGEASPETAAGSPPHRRHADAHAHHGTPVQAMHEAAARSELPARDTAPRRGPWGMIALGGGAALALAAGAALYVTVRSGESRSVLAEASAESPPAPVAAAHSSAPRGLGESVAAASAIALDVLPAAPAESRHAAAAPAPLAAAPKESLAFRVKSAPPGGGKLVLEERPDEAQTAPAAPAQTESAGAAVQASKAGNATDEPGLPPQPSLGAVQAAVGSVMTGARSCLSGQDSGSKATVKFGSAGRVLSVSISGPAAGTPAESCVRSALMGARVPPFSEPSYAASLTIRPP